MIIHPRAVFNYEYTQLVGDQGMVYAFEPQRILHQILCSNFAMNGAFNCHCRLEALGQQAGELVVPPLDINQEGCHGMTDDFYRQ